MAALISPKSTSLDAAARALGLSHTAYIEPLIIQGKVLEAPRSSQGKRRIDVASLIALGVSADAVAEAEQHYARESAEKNARHRANKGGNNAKA